MTWSADEPYNDLPPLPPAEYVETMPVLKAVIEARAAIAGLNEALVSLPNPNIFLHSLALLEAQASSEIENIVTTTDELFKAATISSDASGATREALRYQKALFAGLDAMRARHGIITANTAKEICSTIRDIETDVRHGEGVYIGNPTTRRRIYTPPQGAQVIAQKLKNWEEFVNSSSEFDPLVRVALAHYQFEAIHPFDDGNGRTGRILDVLMLVSAGLLEEPILYISQSIIAQKNEYYRLLNGVTSEGLWEDWTLYMVEAMREIAVNTLAKIKRIQGLQEQIHEVVGSQMPAGVMEVVFEQPYCRIKDVVERCAVTRQTATKYLGELVSSGVLREEKAGREKLFVNEELMEVLKSKEGTVGD
ncbi:Fic family protein [Rothia terrae]|uniref:Fic family protein n=1 Tax=Rothia terrae TaxID=396015 RepID=A0A7H2BDC5_9MICC|nr:Fic family protein [Rothia terrae]QNV37671.1 Fic family protein [Rothia terrae]